MSTNQPSQRILLADDDPVIRHLVTSTLKRDGHIVVAVDDGREAFRILQRDADFKAIIIDMMMPHIEGLEIIRYMRTEKRLSRIPAMMITSERALSLMTESFAAGVTVFLPKPFSVEQLQTMLCLLLNNSNGDDHRPAPSSVQSSVPSQNKTRIEENVLSAVRVGLNGLTRLRSVS